MGSVVPGSVQKLVAREIRRCVAEAVIKDTPCLRVSVCADRILQKYPHCGLDHAALADQIMMAAVKAGVAVELGRPRQEELTAPIPLATRQSPLSPVGR
jgi:hypothetical protein